MTAMKGIQQNMESMKIELSAERHAADDRLLKKMRLTKGIKFKRKGIEKQHIFNEVKDKLETASKALSAIPPEATCRDRNKGVQWKSQGNIKGR